MPKPPAERPLQVRFGPFELDEADARLTLAGYPVRLAPKPFALLCALARRPCKLVTKNDLLDSVWGHRFVTESVLKSAMSELRAALDDDPRRPVYIETVSRRGYRFLPAPGGPAPVGARPSARWMIGRSNELGRLRSAWQRARAGSPTIVWITGEAGMGKTTLIERFMPEAGEARCAHGQCVEQHGAGEPYLPLLEALTSVCRRDAALAELIRASAPTWLAQLPSLSGASEHESLARQPSGAVHARMLCEMARLLERYTQERPLVLVTEDLHWSDHATVQLMDYVARRATNARLLWLASVRLSEVLASDYALSGLCQDIRLPRLVDEIALGGFSRIEVAEYVAARMPSLAGNEALVRALHERTDGLPLFIAAIERELAACSRAPRLVTMPLPESLAGVVERYIAELTGVQRATLEAATVCGASFRATELAQVTGADLASVAECCSELASRERWLRETEGGYAFRYPLYREVLCWQIAPRQRAGMERRLAERRPRRRASSQPRVAVLA